MARIYISLGKVGDVLSVLPILHDEYKRTGIRPKLLISRDYAQLVQQFRYIEPLVYPGSFGDLTGAIRSIKSNGNEAVPLQVYGDTYPVQKKTPSFQLDQWLRAGAIEHFYDWPLVIDGRNQNREQALIKQVARNRPFILFADYSESSPFGKREALASSLNTRFGNTHDLIRLSSVRAQHFCDFVGLYNKASVLVTIETAHLHLSRASSTPVISLITDIPSRWHGSAWHPRMAFQCRYADYDLRNVELMAAIERVLRGRDVLRPELVPTMKLHGYNPAIVENSQIMTYRFHPDETWRTNLAVEVNGQCSTVQFPEAYDGLSQEDARLFWFNGKLHMSFVMANAEFGLWKCVVGYGELVEQDGQWSVPHPIIPKYGQNYWGSLEKNWLFFEHDKKLHFLYATDPEQIVVELDEDQPRKIYKSEATLWPFGKIRGGCLIPHGTHTLRIFHSHTTNGDRNGWVYSIGAALMEKEPPFRTVKISKFPILAGNEKWNPNCSHWKANVVFPGGMIREDNGWKLVYGANDCECVQVHLSEKDLNFI